MNEENKAFEENGDVQETPAAQPEEYTPQVSSAATVEEAQPAQHHAAAQPSYTYYSDGSHQYNAVYRGDDDDDVPRVAPRKSKVKVVLVAVIAVLVVACVVLASVIIFGKRGQDIGNAIKNNLNSAVLGNNAGKNNGEQISEVYESVPEVVTVSPIPDESYDSLVELYDKCSPSCVSILSTVEIDYGFWGTQQGLSLGSGFVIEGTDPKTGKTGFYIITNHHVIENSKSIEVKFYDDETYAATLVGSDEMTDIAVLTIEKTDLVPLEFGDSDQLKVGQWVVAIGTPSDEEFAGTMSYGIISGVNRGLQVTNDYGTVVKTMNVIQTTATLNPGNSGGPLINMAGQVVGINAMKLTQDYEGMGFALPATSAKDVINSLIAYGKVVDRTDSFVTVTAQLGITGADVTDDIKEEYDLGDDCPAGVFVTNVERGTAVYDAGLSAYDVITKFNGVDIDGINALKEELSKASAGTTVSLTFYRPGRRNETGSYHTISFVLDSAA